MAEIVITIDGTAASGKGAIARSLAEHYGYAYLDTGRLYRAFAYLVRELDLEKNDEFLKKLELINSKITPELLADNVLYCDNIGELASYIAAISEVRQSLLQYQLDFIANNKAVILDGRDTGTVICPEAKYKFYIDAEPEIRAKRRFLQQKELALPEQSYAEILEKLVKRDKQDKERKIAPLKIAEGAHVITNEVKELSEIVKSLIEIIDYS